MRQIKNILSALLVVLLIAGCASSKTVPKSEFSGYLGDYSLLKPAKDSSGHEVLRWLSPKLKPNAYSKMILDPIVFYPAPKATQQVSQKTLDQIASYLNKAANKQVGKAIKLTNKPGPGVLRLRIAITGAATENEALKGYEYIPIALIVAGVSTATGERDREAYIVLESELLDSQTGERLGMSVRKDIAKKLLKNDKQQLTLADVKPMLDDLALQAHNFVEHTIK
jgi:hypothetical protein